MNIFNLFLRILSRNRHNDQEKEPVLKSKEIKIPEVAKSPLNKRQTTRRYKRKILTIDVNQKRKKRYKSYERSNRAVIINPSSESDSNSEVTFEPNSDAGVGTEIETRELLTPSTDALSSRERAKKAKINKKRKSSGRNLYRNSLLAKKEIQHSMGVVDGKRLSIPIELLMNLESPNNSTEILSVSDSDNDELADIADVSVGMRKKTNTPVRNGTIELKGSDKKESGYTPKKEGRRRSPQKEERRDTPKEEHGQISTPTSAKGSREVDNEPASGKRMPTVSPKLTPSREVKRANAVVEDPAPASDLKTIEPPLTNIVAPYRRTDIASLLVDSESDSKSDSDSDSSLADLADVSIRTHPPKATEPTKPNIKAPTEFGAVVLTNDYTPSKPLKHPRRKPTKNPVKVEAVTPSPKVPPKPKTQPSSLRTTPKSVKTEVIAPSLKTTKTPAKIQTPISSATTKPTVYLSRKETIKMPVQPVAHYLIRLPFRVVTPTLALQSLSQTVNKRKRDPSIKKSPPVTNTPATKKPPREVILSSSQSRSQKLFVRVSSSDSDSQSSFSSSDSSSSDLDDIADVTLPSRHHHSHSDSSLGKTEAESDSAAKFEVASTPEALKVGSRPVEDTSALEVFSDDEREKETAKYDGNSSSFSSSSPDSLSSLSSDSE